MFQRFSARFCGLTVHRLGLLNNRKVCDRPVFAVKPSASQGLKYVHTSSPRYEMNLSSAIHYLEDGSPTYLAESWDNVGLLVEPSAPHTVHKALLTNDLTLDVCEEAIEKKIDLIISYHPPIFSAMKRLTQKSVKERIVIKCIENRIAVYAPHTVYDTAKDGVNQWIIDSFKQYGLNNTSPIHCKYAKETPCGATKNVTIRVSPKADILLSKIREELCVDDTNDELAKSVVVTKCFNDENNEHFLVNLRLNEAQLTKVTELLEDYPGVLETCAVSELEKLPMPGYGAGLSASFAKELTINSAVESVKKHMKLERLRLALGRGKSVDSTVSSVAVCAGSGRSVLVGFKADLFVTGELSHHDLLACTESGTSVILTEHSNCERGFLHVLKERFEKRFDQTNVEFIVSEKDRDPVCIV